MGIIVTAEAPWSGAAAMPDHRMRPGAAEQAILANGVVLAEHATTPEKRKERQRQQSVVAPKVETAMAFAAAIIAENLPPPPQPTEDLVQLMAGAMAEDEPEGQFEDRLA